MNTRKNDLVKEPGVTVDQRGKRVWLRRTGILAALAGLVLSMAWAVSPAERRPSTQALEADWAARAPQATEEEAVHAAKAIGKPVEIVRARGQVRQVYANPDGTMTALIHQQPVHVAQHGKWVPADATMVWFPNGTVGPRAAVTNLRLSGGGDGLFAVVERAGRRYGLTWPGRLPRPELSGSTATYREVFPDVDLLVHATVTGFTHVLAVKTRQAARRPEVRQVRLGLQTRLLKVRASGDGVEMVDSGTGGVVFATAAARMWDSSGGLPGEDLSRAAPDGAETARVRVSIADGSLVLQPDAAMLDAPDTKYPVYVDPFTAGPGNESWAMVDSGYSNEEYWLFDGKTNERVGYCPGIPEGTCNSSKIKRLFYVLPTGFAGMDILSAKFRVTQYHVENSTPRNVSLYRAGSSGALITTATNWANMPGGAGMSGFVRQDTIAPTGEAGCETGATRNTEFDAYEALSNAAANGWSHTTFMIRSDNESDYRHIKRFCGNAVLSVTYNRAPNRPAVSALSMNPGGSCVTGGSRPYVSSVPALAAALSDPDTADAEPLSAQFEVYWTPSGGSQQMKSWTSGQLGNGDTYTYRLADATVGVPALPENVVVSWRVRASDGTTWGPWSTDGDGHYCEFILDKTKPVGPDIDSPEYLPGDAADNGTANAQNCVTDQVWRAGVGRYGTFTFDSAATDVYKYNYGFDTTPSDANTLSPAADGGPVTLTWLAPSEGIHQVQVVAVDRAGKQSDIATCTFRVAAGSGPVAEWRMEDAPGAATAADATGTFPATAGTATEFGVPGPGGPADKAARLNGNVASSLASAGRVVDTGQNFAVSLWVRVTDLTRYQTILSQDGSGEAGFALAYSPSGTRWYATIPHFDVQTLAATAVYGPVAEQGAWTHIALVSDSTAQKITMYVNGAPVASVNHRWGWSSYGAMQIGRRFSKGGTYSEALVGDLADVRVWDRTLMPDEILSLPSQLTSRQAYWELDGASVVQDSPPLVGKVAGYGPTTEVDPALELSLYSGASVYTRDPQDPFAPPTLVGDGHLVLDGATGYGATANPVATTDSSFTLAARVQPATDCTTGPMTVLAQPGSRASGFNLRCAPDGTGVARWELVLPSADQDAPPGGTVVFAETLRPDPSASAGQFLTLTYDAAYRRVRFYVDGQLMATANGVAAPWRATAGGLQIGRSLVDGAWGSYLAGVVDEVRVYSGALDETTVRQLNTLTEVPTL